MSDAIQDIKYEGLNRFQKLALFLIVIGPEQAAQILQQFDEFEIEMIVREIANFRIIGEDVQRMAIDEFSEIIGTSFGAILGGTPFAQKALEMAKGDYKASTLMGRIAPLSTSTEVMSELSEMDTRMIYNLIRNEQPQTLAFVMSYLSSKKASEVLMMVPQETREEVIERIGTMDKTTPDNVQKVIENIRRHASQKEPTSGMSQSGGVRAVADLLNLLDKNLSKTLLTKLSERNPNLGQAIQRKMFSFDNLISLSQRDLQRVMREIESNDLVVALKAANKPLQQALLGAVSKRAAETLMEEMDMLGPVRLKEVEAAQDRIIQTVRQLEEEGEITIDGGGGDVLV
ncbi:MAG: flagellar motor switch protein FliG [Verrucomicrobiota bacterium JB022]|nr:flagellar motor switch protein FliG [Verrucomicrobiota bacterium JB022]